MKKIFTYIKRWKNKANGFNELINKRKTILTDFILTTLIKYEANINMRILLFAVCIVENIRDKQKKIRHMMFNVNDFN